MRVKLVDNLYEVMVKYWDDENETNYPGYKEFCDNYSGKEVSLYPIMGSWFINKRGDDNHVIPEYAFTSLDPLYQMDWLQSLETKAAMFDWLIEQGEDSHWENILHVDLDYFPSRFTAVAVEYQYYIKGNKSLDNSNNTK